MKKILVFLLAAVMLVGLVACAGNNNDTTTPPTTTKGEDKEDDSKLGTLELIEKRLSEGMDKGYKATTEIKEEELKSVYGLDTEQIVSFVAKKALKADDLVILLQVKSGKNDQAVEALNKYLSGLAAEGEELSEKVLGARLYSADNYVLLIIAGEEYVGSDAEAEKKLADTEYAKVETIIKGVLGEAQKNLADFTVADDEIGTPDDGDNKDDTTEGNDDNKNEENSDDNKEDNKNDESEKN